MPYGTVPGAPLSNGKTFFVFTYIWKEDVSKISAVHGAPRNVSPTWSITWLASLTIYFEPFFNNNSPLPCQFLRDDILLKKKSAEVESSRTHFEVLGLEGQDLGLGLEASSPRKLLCPRLEDSSIFGMVKIL